MGAEIRECPFCAENIPAEGTTCPICNSNLDTPAGRAPGKIAKVKEEILSYIAAANQPARLEGQPGKISLVTHICFVGTLLSIGLCFLGEEGLLVLGVLGACIFGIVLLIVFIQDMMVPSPRGRETAVKAAACYFKSIQFRRWAKAYACLSPMAKKSVIQRGFSDKSSLKSYWKQWVGSDGTNTRRWLQADFRPMPLDANRVRVRVHLKVEEYPNWIMFTILAGLLVYVILYYAIRKTNEYTFDVVVLRHQSQWWMLTGEAGSQLDSSITS